MVIKEKNIENAVLDIFRGLGYEGVLGKELSDRSHIREVVLRERMVRVLGRINSGVSDDDIQKAADAFIHRVGEYQTNHLYQHNKEIYKTLIQGISIETQDGSIRLVRFFDFQNVENNDFLAVSQFSVGYSSGVENKRRVPDIVVFVNGIPLSIVEMKNVADVNATLEVAYQQVVERYVKDIPNFFVCNQLVIVSDGIDTRVGTFCSPFQFFSEWKRAYSEDENTANRSEIETFFEGIFHKNHLMDIIQYFILFSQDGKNNKKIICRYHQYYGVQRVADRAVECIHSPDRDGENKKVGVYWHTQGAGKTFSMIFLLKKIMAQNNILCVFITDRKDLNNQAYTAFEHYGDSQIVKFADSIKDFNTLLQEGGKRIIFSTMQKFDQENVTVNDSHNILVIIDEAHRTQYKERSGIMRDKLPNASFLGITGTPIDFAHRNTQAIFGKVISRYAIDRAMNDGVVVGIGYSPRYVDINISPAYKQYLDRIDDNFKIKDKDVEIDMNRVLGADKRVRIVAQDIVEHFKNHNYYWKGKALVVASTRKNAVKMYKAMKSIAGCPEIDVVLSRYDDLGIEDRKKEDIEKRFKAEDDNLKIVIVCDMWLTGFDVPSLQILYLDKPMKGHTLFQAIARVNRVYREKARGLIVDYIGIESEIKEAVKKYTQETDIQQPFMDVEAIFHRLQEKYQEVCRMLGIKTSLQEFMEQYQDNDTFYGFKMLCEKVITDPYGEGLSDERQDRFLSLAYSILSDYAFLTPLHREAREMRGEMKIIESVVSSLRKKNTLRTKVYVPFDEIIEADKPIPLHQNEKNIFSQEHIVTMKHAGMENTLFTETTEVVRDSIKAIEEMNIYLAENYLEKLESIIKEYKARFRDKDEQKGLLMASDRKNALRGEGFDMTLKKIQVLRHEIQNTKKEVQKSPLSVEENAILHVLKGESKEVSGMSNEEQHAVVKKITEGIKPVLTLDWTEQSQIRARLRVVVQDCLVEDGIPYDSAQNITDLIEKQIQIAYKHFVPQEQM